MVQNKQKVILVSVIIPLYNAEKFILETLNSILNQSVSDIEIIIVDDGSKDGSKKIIDSIDDNRIRYFYKENSGMTKTRNYGLQFARGKYIHFMDHDDIVSEDFYKNKIQKLKNADVVGSKIIQFQDKTDNVIDTFTSVTDNVIDTILTYQKGYATIPSSYLVSKEFIDKNKILFNEKINSIADKEFLILLSKNKAKFIDDIEISSTLFYRKLNSSVSNTFNKSLVDDNEIFYVLLEKDNEIPNKNKYLKIGYKILYRSYFKIGQYKKSLKYFFKKLYI